MERKKSKRQEGFRSKRFTEIFKKMGCKVSSVDLSDAIFVNAKNNKSKNINFFKTSIYAMPFKKIILITFSAWSFTTSRRW